MNVGEQHLICHSRHCSKCFIYINFFSGNSFGSNPSPSWVRKICWRTDRPPTPVFLGFPGGSAGKESVCSAGDLDLIPGLGRSPGEGKRYPLQYSRLENSMDCRVLGVSKSQKQMSNFHFIPLLPASLF